MDFFLDISFILLPHSLYHIFRSLSLFLFIPFFVHAFATSTAKLSVVVAPLWWGLFKGHVVGCGAVVQFSCCQRLLCSGDQQQTFIHIHNNAVAGSNIYFFSEWLRIRLISAGLELVLSHTENSSIVKIL